MSHVPFEALPVISSAARKLIEEAALAANDRYLETFLEPNSFCPFSRAGRLRGQTLRFVHYADTTHVEPLLDRMAEAARDPSKAVVQVIVPMIEVSPDAWIRFCHALTTAGNERLRSSLGRGNEIYAVAPLHPELSYSSLNPYALVPLLRRTPDPTIQWVRLDALDRLYEGRTGDTVFADPDDLASFFAQPRRPPLLERIAETNLKMAHRLGLSEVERALRELARAARDSYAQVLLSDSIAASPRPPKLQSGCAHHARLRSDTTPPVPALYERDGRWALVEVGELVERVPRRFLAAGVELVAVRVGEKLHVLHGRCPHRNAPMSDAVVEADRLVCPHHGWDFELESGHSEGVPGASLARFGAWIAAGLLWVDGKELQAWRSAHLQVFEANDDIL